MVLCNIFEFTKKNRVTQGVFKVRGGAREGEGSKGKPVAKGKETQWIPSSSEPEFRSPLFFEDYALAMRSQTHSGIMSQREAVLGPGRQNESTKSTQWKNQSSREAQEAKEFSQRNTRSQTFDVQSGLEAPNSRNLGQFPPGHGASLGKMEWRTLEDFGRSYQMFPNTEMPQQHALKSAGELSLQNHPLGFPSGSRNDRENSLPGSPGSSRSVSRIIVFFIY